MLARILVILLALLPVLSFEQVDAPPTVWLTPGLLLPRACRRVTVYIIGVSHTRDCSWIKNYHGRKIEYRIDLPDRWLSDESIMFGPFEWEK